MADPTDALLLDLVEWMARQPRPYAEVIETWRTSCPRLTIWEDAVDRGYLARTPGAGAGGRVDITEVPAGMPGDFAEQPDSGAEVDKCQLRSDCARRAALR